MESNKPKQLYKTLLLDPPWDIEQKGGRGAIKHYDLMTLDRIKAMPVGDLAEENAHIWMWVTNASIRHGYDVMENFGFTPRSILTWVKPRFTLGVYLRNATEHLILGTRGKAPVQFHGQATWLFAPLQDHSHKPEEQYAIIERVSPGPYLELFARRRQPGWDAWGLEAPGGSDIVIPGYPVPGDENHGRGGIMRRGKPAKKVNRKNHGNSRAFCPERVFNQARRVLYPRNLAGALNNRCRDRWYRHWLARMEKQGQMVREDRHD